MNWIKNIFKKKQKEVTVPVKALKSDFRKAKKYNYICECVLNYDDQPVRRTKFRISAYTRSHAEEQIRERMKIRVVRTVKEK